MLPIICISASEARYTRSGAHVLMLTCCGLRQQLVATQHGLNFSTAWCTVWLNSVSKDWKHVLMQNVVTLKTCCDIACLTFQLPHIITGSFQSHRWQSITGSVHSLQRLKECNKPSVRWKSFAFHKFMWWHSQVRWTSGLVCFLLR